MITVFCFYPNKSRKGYTEEIITGPCRSTCSRSEETSRTLAKQLGYAIGGEWNAHPISLERVP